MVEGETSAPGVSCGGGSSGQPRALAPGQRISHFRVIDFLGAGGMGEVYLAEDERLSRKVALKLVPRDRVADADARQRLEEEARAAAALSHPNVATVHELGEAEGTVYIAMEYVAGETLADVIARKPLDAMHAVDVAVQIAAALEAAHSAGLIHRDIKSSNVALNGAGSVKVLDFGLAVLRMSLDVVSTSESSRGGTAGYMSPEQWRSEPIDARTDIFSLGVVLFEMLTGRRPFDGDGSASVCQAVLTSEPPLLGTFGADVPLDLERIIRKALEKDRELRYESAGAMRRDLCRMRESLERWDVGAGAAEKRMDADGGSSDPAASTESLTHVLWPLLASAAGGFLRFCTLRRTRRRIPVITSSGGAAFRGLAPFQEVDRLHFLGREPDIAAVFEMVQRSDFRFGVLYGESGCGKTSLLRAGLIPRLWESGLVPIYCRSQTDPMECLLAECKRLSGFDRLMGEALTVYLGRVATELGGTIVVVCDQFEEFFINFETGGDREPFLGLIESCHAASGVPVKFLLAIRSDFLHLISTEFAGRVSEPLMSTRLHHLRMLDEQQAAEIIERSARRAGLPFEQDLSRQISRDVAVHNAVLPSELQIVGVQLQSKRIFTLDGYRRAGGKEPLVYSFLEDVIRATGDQETALVFLRSLISEENTRHPLTIEEIVKRTQHSRGSIERLLKMFVQSRLVSEIQNVTPYRYELMHEYLIAKINRISGRVMDATQRANRLFRQYLLSYSADRRARIPTTKLWFIRRHSDLERGEREQELLRKSLRWGVVKAATFALLLAIITVFVAALLSVNDQWEERLLLDGHRGPVHSAAFSPDGRLLVTVSEDGTAIVWDFARRIPLATLTDHSGWVTTAAFSPDGLQFATGGRDGKVMVYDSKSHKRVTALPCTSPVAYVTFTQDSKRLVTCDAKETLLWDATRWQIMSRVPVGTSYQPLLLFPDGRGARLSSTRIFWDPPSEAKWIEDKIPSTSWEVFSPSGRLLAQVSSDGNVLFWGLDPPYDLDHVKLLGQRLAHQDHGRAAAFSPDEKWLATGSEEVVLWDVAQRRPVGRLEHGSSVWSVAFSPDGQWLVSTHSDGAVLVWNVEERSLAADLRGHSGPVRAVAFSPDGRRVASAGEDRTVIIWDVANDRKSDVLTGHATRLTGIAFSPDGRSVAACEQNTSRLVFWDILGRRQRWCSQGNPDRVFRPLYCVAVSPDGRWVASSAGIYDALTGRYSALPRLGADNALGSAYALTFSPDGRTLWCGTDGRYVFQLDVRTWTLGDSLFVKEAGPEALAPSPDGKWLVGGGNDGVLRIFQTHPLRQLEPIAGPPARIYSVAFSPDGRLVASGSSDGNIRLWDFKRRELVKRIESHSASVLSLAFSPDGKSLVSGGGDKTVRLHTLHRTLWGYSLD